MERLMTAAVERALAEAAAWTNPSVGRIDAPALLLGLLTQSECRAAILLNEHGIDARRVCQRFPTLRRQGPGGQAVAPGSPEPASVASAASSPYRFSREVEWAWRLAAARLADCPQPIVFGTEHVLLALACGDHEVSQWLRQQGIDPDMLDAQLHAQYGCHLVERAEADAQPLDMPEDEAASGAAAAQVPAAGSGVSATAGEAICGGVSSPARGPISLPTSAEPALGLEGGPTASPGQASVGQEDFGQASLAQPPVPQAPHWQPKAAAPSVAILRILDAVANRAGEGLRVVEDFVRFVLDDRQLTERCKRLRHELAAALARVPFAWRLAARETLADVGTKVSTPSEQVRGDAAEVARANFVRLQESLRSLEEYAKTFDSQMAAEMERLRYAVYTVHRAVETTQQALCRLANTRLYVLVDGRGSAEELVALVDSLVRSGVDAVQLRDKRLEDRELLERAKRACEAAHAGGALLIINDRPDLAVLAGADGVHLGQNDLSVKDARTLVGPEALVGVSTHSIDQARQAVLDGASYLGVGPVFPSATKHFEEFPGLGLLRAVAAEIRLPAFAIGGIHHQNVGEVLGTGIGRIAVSSAVVAAADPAQAARQLKSLLDQAWR